MRKNLAPLNNASKTGRFSTMRTNLRRTGSWTTRRFLTKVCNIKYIFLLTSGKLVKFTKADLKYYSKILKESLHIYVILKFSFFIQRLINSTGIAKKSRSIFLELDANAKHMAPLSPPAQEPPKRKEIVSFLINKRLSSS